MSLAELRTQAMKLYRANTIKDCLEMTDIYANFQFLAIYRHHMDPVQSAADTDAKIIFQMMATKVLNLKNVLHGISYTSSQGLSLNSIIDPTIVASSVRNAMEMAGMFHLIYCATKSPDEKKVLYNLWVHTGLAYRQRFTENATSSENIEKAKEEKEHMDFLRKEIEDTPLYKTLSTGNQQKIQRKLKDKDYLMYFQQNEVKYIHWHDLPRIMGVKEKLFENLYTYLSLYAHPSNVSVFQFSEFFHPGDNSSVLIALFNIKNAFIIISIFIADYIRQFPNLLDTFNHLPLIHQLAINFHNTVARGYAYSINDSWQELG